MSLIDSLNSLSLDTSDELGVSSDDTPVSSPDSTSSLPPPAVVDYHLFAVPQITDSTFSFTSESMYSLFYVGSTSRPSPPDMGRIRHQRQSVKARPSKVKTPKVVDTVKEDQNTIPSNHKMTQEKIEWVWQQMKDDKEYNTLQYWLLRADQLFDSPVTCCKSCVGVGCQHVVHRQMLQRGGYDVPPQLYSRQRCMLSCAH